MPEAIPADQDILKFCISQEKNAGNWVPSKRLPPRPPARVRPQGSVNNWLARHRQLTYQEIQTFLSKERPDHATSSVYHYRDDEPIMEKLDPKHRPGYGLVLIWDFYLKYECYQRPVTLHAEAVKQGFGTRTFSPSVYFFTWIDMISSAGWVWTCTLMQYAYSLYWDNYVKDSPNWKPGKAEWDQLAWVLGHWPGMNTEAVRFLTGIQTLRCRVWRTQDGKLGYNFNILKGTGELLHTGNSQTAFGTSGFIWTLNQDYNFYTIEQKVGQHHHSTLTAGQGVLAAGEWIVDQGELKLISAQTGHYKVPMKSLVTAINHINNRLCISPNKYNVKLFKKKEGLAKTEMLAGDFLRRYQWNPNLMEDQYQVFSK